MRENINRIEDDVGISTWHFAMRVNWDFRWNQAHQFTINHRA